MIDPACADRDSKPSERSSTFSGSWQMIPHRYPFLMIDRVVDVVANERATGIKNVSINEHYFQGHFPRAR